MSSFQQREEGGEERGGPIWMVTGVEDGGLGAGRLTDGWACSIYASIRRNSE